MTRWTLKPHGLRYFISVKKNYYNTHTNKRDGPVALIIILFSISIINIVVSLVELATRKNVVTINTIQHIIMLTLDASRVTYVRNYTARSDVLNGLPLKEEYEKFRIEILRTANWSTWHGRLRKRVSLEKGWCINIAHRDEILAALEQWNIPFVIIDSDSLPPTTRGARNRTHAKKHNKRSAAEDNIYASLLPSLIGI